MGLKRKNPARIRLLTLADAAIVRVAAPPPAAAERPAPPAPAPPRISGEERRRMIARAAYGHAERAGFAGDPVRDWLVAEREVDAWLSRMAS
jgi:hypothetical protein